MAMSNKDSRRTYSWWWNSHISPKNSKWLQENLTDIDGKVKQMIKVIEEDADSFARRAEMYYKRRPELLKLVEEFYRAYRALAERYDNATGVIRQAHRTMAEAFPDQVPTLLGDDSPAGYAASDADPRTPEIPHPTRAFLDPEELHKDAMGLSSPHFHVKRNGAFTEEPASVTSRKGLKQLNDLFGSREGGPGHAKFAEGKVRKGLNFEVEEKDKTASEQGSRYEADILLLKESLAKVEVEKEAGLVQYQQSLERLSNLESEVSRAKEDSRHLNECASRAEIEIKILKETLANFEVEKEESLLKYQQCLERISNLENSLSSAQEDTGKLNERASKAETEAQVLKQELAVVKAEKEVIFAQHKQSLTTISDTENKLMQAEEDARLINERADKAEREIENLKKDITRLADEKEAFALQYQQCLEIISNLEHNISSAEEEAKRLNGEIDDGVAKLKGAEERCLSLEKSNQSLQSEMELLEQKMGSQSQELTDKQQELARLWICIQEERLRFVEAETAFQTLQHLHSQSQEELKSLVSELQNKVQNLENLETLNRGLQDEVLKAKEENKSLNVLNLSSAVSMENMHNEISDLKETIAKLQQEVDLRVDQRNALQQEIYCLKEELNDLNKKHDAMLEQVESVGLNPECIGSSVKELQDENVKLHDVFQREKSEKEALLDKLEVMKKLLEKNSVLENSLADLNVELDGVKEKLKALEESCEMLVAEKSTLSSEKATLVAQLQMMTENSSKLSEQNAVLESSLLDVNGELEGLREKSQSLEYSFQLLDNEKGGLIFERGSLLTQLEIAQQRLEDFETRYEELAGKSNDLEKERESLLCTVEDLRGSLDVEKHELANFSELYETRLASLESQILCLQEKGWQSKKKYDEELDKTIEAQIEIFILQKCVQEMHGKNFTLSVEFQELFKASKLLEITISQMENKNLEHQFEVKALFDQLQRTRMDMHQVLLAFDTDSDYGCENKVVQDQTHVNQILDKLQGLRKSLSIALEENCQLVLEKSVLSTLLVQLRLDAAELESEKSTFSKNLSITRQKFLTVQSEKHKLLEMNEGLRLMVNEGVKKEELLRNDIDSLRVKLLQLQGAYQNLQKQNSEVIAEKQSLMKEFLELNKDKHALADENYALLGETLCLNNISLVFQNFVSEKAVDVKELGEILEKIHSIKEALEQNVKILEGKFEMVSAENLHLKESLEKLENELKTVRLVSDQLTFDISYDKDLLHQKEMELSEAEKKIVALQSEKMDFQKEMENLKMEHDQIKVIKDNQEEHIFKLSEENGRRIMENEQLSEVIHNLEAALSAVHEKHEETKTSERTLGAELQKGKNESEQWENEAAMLFSRLQISAVYEALFTEKVHELNEKCQSLESTRDSKAEEIHLLKERVGSLEYKNGGLEAQLALYITAVNSLKDFVASMESHTLFQDKLHKEEEANNFVSQKAADVKEVGEVLDKIHSIKEALEQNVKIMEGKIEMISAENLYLKESLEKSENELKTVRLVGDQLTYDIAHGNDLMHQKKMELSAAETKLVAVQSENMDFQKEMENLKMEYDQIKVLKGNQEEHIFKLSEESKRMSQVIHNLEAELSAIREKHEETKVSERTLTAELQKGRNESEQWENEAEVLFSRLQTSAIYEALLTEKVHELNEKCQGLENTRDSRAEEIHLLKERVGSLEDKNGGLEAQLALHITAVNSLKDCVASLESCTLFQDKLHKAVDEEAKDAKSSSHLHADDCREECDNISAKFPDGVSKLQELQCRITAIEKAVDDIEKLRIKESQSEIFSHQGIVETGRHTSSQQEDEELPKDIMLDQTSECSSHGISKRETVEADDQMLESCETTDNGGSIDQAKKQEKCKEENPSSEIVFEKELGVIDKSEISKRFTVPSQSQEGNKRKILERLDSDSQKLTNLQITVQDLKEKVKITEKSKKGKGIEYDTVKEQLEEAEEAIMKLFDMNGKLKKNIEDGFFPSDGKTGMSLEESESVRGKRFSEHARRGSEKIGRLQLEVQKLQFLLLKLDGKKESRKTRISERSPRVILRDYLYGVRANHSRMQKKSRFCACVRPQTKGD